MSVVRKSRVLLGMHQLIQDRIDNDSGSVVDELLFLCVIPGLSMPRVPGLNLRLQKSDLSNQNAILDVLDHYCTRRSWNYRDCPKLRDWYQTDLQRNCHPRLLVQKL